METNSNNATNNALHLVRWTSRVQYYPSIDVHLSRAMRRPAHNCWARQQHLATSGADDGFAPITAISKYKRFTVKPYGIASICKFLTVERSVNTRMCMFELQQPQEHQHEQLVSVGCIHMCLYFWLLQPHHPHAHSRDPICTHSHIHTQGLPKNKPKPVHN